MNQKYVVIRDKSGSAGPLKAAGGGRPPGGRRVGMGFESEFPEDENRDGALVAQAPAKMMVRLVHPHGREISEAIKTRSGMTDDLKLLGLEADGYTGDGVSVAVLDTGIEASHPVFAALLNRDGLVCEDFTGDGMADRNGHGTHCAAKIAGDAIDGMRYSIAPGIKRLIVGKVLKADGSGSIGDVYRGIKWAVEDEGADIVSMSLGVDCRLYIDALQKQGYSREFAEALGLAQYGDTIRLCEALGDYIRTYSRGTLLIAAAGNESRRSEGERSVAPALLPAVANPFLSVGAVTSAESPIVAEFANSRADCVAPGISIHSASRGGGYESMSGTSMATAIVAGVAALWCEHLHESDRSHQLREMLLGSCRRISGPSNDVGFGLVQAPKRSDQ